MVDIQYIRQKEPRGLGHAIKCSKTFVYNHQKLCLKQLIDCYDGYKTSILGVQSVL